MAFVLADFTQETSTLTGTGSNITLDGAVSGFKAFGATLSNNDETFYTVYQTSTGAYETGRGTYNSAGDHITRDSVYMSSAGAGTKVNFSAGAKNVICDTLSTGIVELNAHGTGGENQFTTTAIGTTGRALLDDADAPTARATISAQEDVVTTAGDMIRGNASTGNAERFARGTSRQGLRMNTAGNQIEWALFVAVDIQYNNVSSGLSATEVQAALDEIEAARAAMLTNRVYAIKSGDQLGVGTGEVDITGLTGLTIPGVATGGGTKKYRLSFDVSVSTSSTNQPLVKAYIGATGDKGDTLICITKAVQEASAAIGRCWITNFEFTPTAAQVKIGLSFQESSGAQDDIHGQTPTSDYKISHLEVVAVS
jgi:hypothetical protein